MDKDYINIRIVSDLHIDINKKYGVDKFAFINNDTDILIIAGDIAGGWQKECVFLNKIKDTQCICVGGNHLGYDYSETRLNNKLLDINDPLEETKKENFKRLKQSLNDNIHYLDDEYIELDNYIIFGGTMYSDFLLYGNKNRQLCKHVAERWLNDFRNVHILEDNVIRPINSDDYIKYFHRFKRRLNKCIKETSCDKDIIVVTHFAPSIKSIHNKYRETPTLTNPGKYLNAAYASNLESFIKDNPRIKFWIHGHTHNSFDYYISQCRVICEPYGYCNIDTDILPCKYEGKELILKINKKST